MKSPEAIHNLYSNLIKSNMQLDCDQAKNQLKNFKQSQN